jgi:hypothetical protein
MKYETDIVNIGHVKQLGNIWVYIFSYIYIFIKICNITNNLVFNQVMCISEEAVLTRKCNNLLRKTYASMYMWTCMYVYVCMHVCMYACVYV